MLQITAILLTAFILGTPASASGAPLELSLSADKSEVGLDDYLTVQLTVSGESLSSSPDVAVEGLEEFEIRGKSSSTQVSIVNMDFKKTNTTTYSLVPKSSGKTVTLKASATSGGKIFFSNAIKVKLVKSSAKSRSPSRQQARRGGSLFGGMFDHDIFQGQRDFRKDDFMLLADVSATQVYVGQEIGYTIAFYQRYQIRDGANFNFPESKGFWKEELPEDARIKTKDVTVSDKLYRISEMSRLLYPLTDGKFMLGKGDVSFQVNAFSSAMRLKSNDIEIEVLALPEKGKPENFSGLVGDYSIKAEISDSASKAGKPITLKIIVAGNGNIHAIPKPDEPALKLFEKYEPETADNFSRTAGGSVGARTFKYILVPKKKGDIEIGSFTINFFNPETGQYLTIKTKPIIINTYGEAGEHRSYGKATSEGKPQKRVAKSLRPIKTATGKLKETREPYYERGIFWGYILLLASLLFGASAYIRKKEAKKLAEMNGDSLTPIDKAKKRLAEAKRLLMKGDADRFYMELDKAVRPYAAFKLGIGSEGRTSLEELKSEINANGGKSFTFVLEIIEKCETIRFGPVMASKKEMEDALEKAKKALSEMENES